MTIEEARQRVLDFVYGEMSAQEAQEFQSLLARDGALQAEVDSVRAVRAAASGLGSVEMPASVRRRLLAEARRAVRARAVEGARSWSFLERFFLSPAFSGALVVAVAVGVGIQLLMEVGTEDRWVRLERAERAAVSGRKPADEPEVPEMEAAAPSSGKTEPPPVAAERERAEAPTGGTARLALTRGTGSRWSAVSPRKQESAGGRRAGVVGRSVAEEPQAKGGLGATARVRETPAAVPQEVLQDRAAGALEDRALRSRTTAEDARPEKTVVPRAASTAGVSRDEGAPAAAEVAEGPADLERARRLRAHGDLHAALRSYQAALDSGRLSGDRLQDALAEATEVAIALKALDTARGLVNRLKALPGGPARAAPLEQAIEAQEKR